MPRRRISVFGRPYDTTDQTAFGGDLNGAMAEHLDCVTAFSSMPFQYGDNCPTGMITEGLIDLVADCEFGRH